MTKGQARIYVREKLGKGAEVQVTRERNRAKRIVRYQAIQSEPFKVLGESPSGWRFAFDAAKIPISKEELLAAVLKAKR